MSIGFFDGIEKFVYEGVDSICDLVFWYYNFDEIVMGKWMEEYLCFVIVYWYSFVWEGGDFFGGQMFVWFWYFQDDMGCVKMKVDVVFELFDILNVFYFCWYDVDICFEQGNFVDNLLILNEIIDYIGEKM